MNTAYIKMQKEHARKERRSDYIAAAVGFAALTGGALIGAAMLYAFTFIFLSIGV